MEAWPLVGRSNEISLVTAAVSENRSAVVIGPAGVGKTSLGSVCLQLAQKGGMKLAQTTATHSSRRLPFGAFASILPPVQIDDALFRGDRPDLVQRYVQVVVESARGRPLFIFVDDAHLLDDGSAMLLHQLALRRSAAILATVRSGESAPDPVVALWKDGLAERIEIGLLNDGAVEDLLTAVLGGPIDAASLHQLIGHSQGNPLFLRELVNGALETGSLIDEGGIWRLKAPLRPTSRLVELVALRLGALSDPERAALELLALVEPLEQVELAQLVDPMAIESLEQKGLIATRADGRRVEVWLGHPVYGDVMRVGISALRERNMARALAEVFEEAGGSRPKDGLLLASLRLVGGGGSRELLEGGAIAARTRHDHSLAERLARAAIDEGSGFVARYVAAEAAHFQGRLEEAERELGLLARDATGDNERVSVAILRFDNTFFLHGRLDLHLLDEVDATTTDAFWHNRLLDRRAYVGLAKGPRAVVEDSSILERSTSGSLTAAHGIAAYGLYRSGRTEDAVTLLSPTADGGPALPTGDSWEEWATFAVVVEALCHAGRLDEAEALIIEAHNVVVDQPAAESRALVSSRFALVNLEQGKLHSAIRRAKESYTLFLQLGRSYQSRWPSIFAVQALAYAGQADHAAETLAAYDALGASVMLMNETDLLQARAWTAAAAGDLPTARRGLEAAAQLGDQIGDVIGEATALHGLARLGRAAQAAPRLTALAEKTDGHLVSARAAYARAIAERDPEALQQVARDFEDMGTLLYATEAHAESAVLLQKAGRARAATAAEQNAARLLDRCEGANTPPLRTVTARARLTPTELDVALKAVAGKSNKEIANDMYLSLRTVESHLHSAYAKLGIRGRRELAEALERATA
jgi:DNA-binding CsgD family transcriptional regulator